jgi:hypothetical protein
MRYEQNTWLVNPNRGRNHFPHNFWRSKHMISKSKSKAVTTFLIPFGTHMNILSNIEVKIVVLINWSYTSKLAIELGMLRYLKYAVHSLSNERLFWYPFLEPQLTTILKCGCPIKRSNRIRHVHLNSTLLNFGLFMNRMVPSSIKLPQSRQPICLL